MDLFFRKTLFFKVSLCIILAFPGQFILVPHTIAQPSLAPLNPDFVKYIRDLEMNRIPGSTADGSGYIPSPLDFSHLKGLSAFQIKEFSEVPSWYDLRTLGKVTPAKTQNPCGSCWAFAAYASLESNLLPSEAWDFSENHLVNTHGFNNASCAGGNNQMVTAYLARWSGPVNEAEDPFYSEHPYPVELPARKHIQEVLILPDRAGPLDNDHIKEAIMKYGAITTAMDFRNRSPYYYPMNFTYYFGGLKENWHAVAIIGWDDQFPKERFFLTPPGDGAFIVKNSYGEKWGENGFFYVSYYDTIFGTGNGNYVYNGAEPTTNYSHIYQYDPLGWTSQCGAGSGNTAWFANIFTAIASDSLKAVSFYTASLESPYEVYIYLNTTQGPVSGSLAGTKTGSISLPGYHTIRLDSPIPLTAGQMFSVVVRLTTPNYNWPIPIELPKSGYSTAASAGAGQSYFSADGAHWWDLITTYPNANVCLKAFTGNVFADIPPGYWAQDYINAISHAGITTGYGDGRFGPDDFVTREQMAKFIIKAIEGEPPENYCDTGVPFTDVTADMWSCRFIKRLKELGITQGYLDGGYGPMDLISREQMAVFLVGGIGEIPSANYCGTGVPFTDVTADMWSCRYIKRLAMLGISMGYGDGRYGPYDAVTRAQMAVFLTRAFLD